LKVLHQWEEKKLNIGRRMLKESNQGSNAAHTTSTHAQGSKVEETHRTLTHRISVTTQA
jgi:hypothetical protein